MNTRISAEKKMSLINMLRKIEEEAKGSFVDFEEIILCDLKHDDMQIIHPVGN